MSRFVRVLGFASWFAGAAGCFAAQPQSDACRTFVACRDALNAMHGAGEPGLDRYRETGACWSAGNATECTTHCQESLVEIRRTEVPLPAACNAAMPAAATPYDPLPPEGACSAPRHLEAETAGIVGLRTLDFEGDGDIDLASLGNDSTLALYRNDGTGRFVMTRLMVNPASNNLDVADVTSDGRADLLVFSARSESITVFAAAADGTFSELGSSTGFLGVDPAYGDFDGDGHIDAFLAASAVGGRALFSRGDGAGHFAMPATVTPGFTIATPVAFDPDEDGDLDVLVTSGDTFALAIARNDGHANFTFSQLGGSSLLAGQAIAVADLDADHHVDIAALGVDRIAGDAPLVATVLFGDGTGSFGGEINLGEAFGPNGFAAADTDSDGTLDLVAGREHDVIVARGLGGRMFATPARRAFPMLLRELAVVDFDGDHRNDLVVGGLADSSARESLEFAFTCRGE